MHAVISTGNTPLERPGPAAGPARANTTLATVWMTGRRGSGRRTLGRAVVAGLAVAGRPAVILDDARIAAAADASNHSPAGPALTRQGDDVNPLVACAAELAMALASEGVVAIVVATSPRVGDRERIRREHERRGLTFVEVFVDTPPAVSAVRDGADPGYEEPPLPDLVVRPGPLLPAVLSIVDLV